MTAEAQAEGAIGIAVDGADNVYVMDTVNCRVKKYNSSGNLVGEWSCAGPGTVEVERSVGVTVDGAGNVYLLDAGTYRMRKYTPSGLFVGEWGFGGTECAAEPEPEPAPKAAPPTITSSPAAQTAAA